MDFSEIEKKVMEYKYSSLISFIEELNLVFTNCYDFNGPLNGKIVISVVVHVLFNI